jgi:phosphate transport system substrate-binding protein
MKIPTKFITTAALAGLTLGLASCKRETVAGASTIRVNGSDTMLQVGTAWQEAYMANHSLTKVTMGGEGSGVGFNLLLSGDIDVAQASREIKDSEKAEIKAKYGKDAVEHIVGFDGIAVFCNKANPVKSLTVEQLKGIYAADGEITDWKQIDPSFEGKIDVYGRANNSGTHVFFKEFICGKGVEYKQDISASVGSSALVESCMTDKVAIGYSGMGYIRPEVGVINVIGEDGVAYEPTVANVQSKKYPIARALYIYTIGEPEGATKEFIDWIKSDEGQAILEAEKFVPLR